MKIGIGCYPQANHNEVVSMAPDFCIVMNNRPAAELIRQALGQDVVIGWREYNAIPNTTGDPLAEARRVAGIILAGTPGRDVVDFVAGANEYMGHPPNLAFAIPFELELCRQIQAAGRAYAWGSIACGNLDPDVFVQFHEVLAIADATLYHPYIKPNNTRLERLDEPWWFWRPKLWYDACRAQGLRFPIVVGGEGGSYYNWRDMHLAPSDVTQIMADSMAGVQELQGQGIPYLGIAVYGFGLEGNESRWNLDGTTFVEGALAFNIGQPPTARQAWENRPRPGPPPPPPPPPPAQGYTIEIAPGTGYAYANLRDAPDLAESHVVGRLYRYSRVPATGKSGRFYVLRGGQLFIHDSVARPIGDEPMAEIPIMAWPVLEQAHVITDPFDTPRDYGNKRHEGLDIRAYAGKPVVPVWDGVVHDVRDVDPGTGYGIRVIVAHDFGGAKFRTWYAHLRDTRVIRGQKVIAGATVLGHADATGNVVGKRSHLHLTLQDLSLHNDYVVSGAIDPTPFLPPPYQVL